MNNNLDFRFLRFYTAYKAQINQKEINALHGDACFGTAFRGYKNGINNSEYELHIFKGDTILKDRKNNACFLSLKELHEHIKWLGSFVKIKYSIKEEKDKYILNISFDGNGVLNKFVLSWIRYTYEFPFNMFLLDAHKINRQKGNKTRGLINLFNIVGASSGIDITGTGIHAIGNSFMPKESLTKKQIKVLLDSGGNGRVNDIFKEMNRNLFETIKNANVYSFDYWDSEEKFKERYKVYLCNIRKLNRKNKYINEL